MKYFADLLQNPKNCYLKLYYFFYSENAFCYELGTVHFLWGRGGGLGR